MRPASPTTCRRRQNCLPCWKSGTHPERPATGESDGSVARPRNAWRDLVQGILRLSGRPAAALSSGYLNICEGAPPWRRKQIAIADLACARATICSSFIPARVVRATALGAFWGNLLDSSAGLGCGWIAISGASRSGETVGLRPCPCGPGKATPGSGPGAAKVGRDCCQPP
jgi:hypothetical protein